MGVDGDGSSAQWKSHVDTRLTKIDLALADNTSITTQLVSRLEDHQRKTAPVIEAIENMQAGVRVLGKIGNGVAWCGRFAFRSIKVLAPIAAAVATVWAVWKGFWKP